MSPSLIDPETSSYICGHDGKLKSEGYANKLNLGTVSEWNTACSTNGKPSDQTALGTFNCYMSLKKAQDFCHLNPECAGWSVMSSPDNDNKDFVQGQSA